MKYKKNWENNIGKSVCMEYIPLALPLLVAENEPVLLVRKRKALSTDMLNIGRDVHLQVQQGQDRMAVLYLRKAAAADKARGPDSKLVVGLLVLGNQLVVRMQVGKDRVREHNHRVRCC